MYPPTEIVPHIIHPSAFLHTKEQIQEKAKGKEQKESQAWRAAARQVRDKNSWPRDYQPWTTRPAICTPNVLCDRQKDVIDVAWGCKLAAKPRGRLGDMRITVDKLKAGVFADVTLSIPRAFAGRIRALKRGARYYSYEFDGTLPGWHHLRINGYPSNLSFSSQSDSQCRDIAGESFALPCVASVLWSLHLIDSMPWWR